MVPNNKAQPSLHGIFSEHPDVIIYKNPVDKRAEPILLLGSDENVFFFLDKNSNLFTQMKILALL